MKPGRFSSACRRWCRTGALLLCLAAGSGAIAVAQTTPPQEEYYETCLRQGFLPGTTPMRRCILAQRAIDLDPLSALAEFQLTPPDPAQTRAADAGLEGEFPGARDAEEMLKSAPEALLIGPDYRAQGQGIYE